MKSLAMNAADSGANEVILASGTKGTIIEVIGFVVVVAILLIWIAPLAVKAMSAKQEAIAKQIADSEAAGRKLAEAQSAYDNALAEARIEAARLRDDAQAQYQAIVDEAAAAAQARADEISARAREQLEAERVTAVRQLQAEIATLTVKQAEEKVRAALSDEGVQRRVTDRFLSELESGRVTGAATATGGRSE